MTALSARQMRRQRRDRAEVDYDARKFFIYRVHDDNGAPVYIGRSCNVRARLRGHYGNLNHPGVPESHKPTWLLEARSVSLLGPFTWSEACRVERTEIEAHQPRGNRMFTKAHGYRPLSEGGGQYVGRQPHSP